MAKKSPLSNFTAPLTIPKDHRPLTALEILRMEWMHADEVMEFLRIKRTKFYQLRDEAFLVPYIIDTIQMYSISEMHRTLMKGKKL